MTTPETHEWPAMADLYAALVTVAREVPFLSSHDRALLLRDAVCAAVDELRVGGRTSERVVFLVKMIAAEAGIDEERHREVIEQLTAWCVQRFYAP
jgi:hypothetical protein